MVTDNAAFMQLVFFYNHLFYQPIFYDWKHFEISNIFNVFFSGEAFQMMH